MKCSICGKTSLTYLGKNPSFPSSEIYQCDDCEFGLTVPLPTQEILLNFYKPGMYIRDDNLKALESRLLFSSLRAKSQFQFMQKFFPKVECPKALELGCSEGSLLLLLDQYGFNVTAYEPDARMAELANNRLNKKENKVINRMFEEDNLGHEQYDLIFSSHVLEHLTDPVSHIQAISKALTRDGILFLEVPNEFFLEIFVNPIFKNNGHIYCYSPKSLRKILVKNNFNILYLRTCGKNVVDINKNLVKRDLNRLEYEIVKSISFMMKKIIYKLQIDRYQAFSCLLNQLFAPQKLQNDPFMTYWPGHMQGQWIRLIAKKK